ncbi:hypothetical protein [Paraburkholderia pallida]|uniref:hypothetical protein n=1 Tax=Paraburkholderia pallida TaxID=2547399 RepID=UPI0018D671AA|nr:hypothetical protein [Paraburkholderia pallida]
MSETAGGELLFTFGERTWRVRGWQKNLGPEQMRVNAQVRRGEHYHVDTLDVYSAKARGLYLKAAAVELGSQEDTLKRDLGRVLLKLEALQDEAIRATLAPKDKPAVELDALEHAAALDWLKAPDRWRGSRRTWRAAAWWAKRRTCWLGIWRRYLASSMHRSRC